VKKLFKIVGVVLGIVLLAAVGSFLYAKRAAAQRLDKDYQIQVAAIPMPFPLTEDELDALRKERAATAPQGSQPGGTAAAQNQAEPAEANAAPGQEAAAEDAAPAADPLEGVDLDALALERALERGKGYLESRAGCADCHGEDFGGKVIVDHPMMGRWVAPNITRGGLTKNYRAEDWVRIVRHGVKPNGKPATMPSIDFTWFSDQEISDIATYISHQPPVDRIMPPSDFGPVFAFLTAFSDNQVNAEFLDHTTQRSVYPPSTSAASLELGKHLASTCMGCHGPEFAGGKIPGGDPAWPPAANLTFHETGLATWSLEDFQRVMREGKRPDGRTLDPIMPIAYTKNLKETETEALYMYLKTVPKLPQKP
jgi:mono/diheme cytochrome c family protein